MSALEQAALDGRLFAPSARPPRRDSLDTDSDDDTYDTHFGGKTHTSSSVTARRAAPNRNSVYGGTGARRGAQTGPKGVLNDHEAHQAAERAAMRASLSATRAQQEQRAITAPSYRQEQEMAKKLEAVALDDDEEVASWRKKRLEEMRMKSASAGLREVGKHGFVAAVERKGWVCVLIYEPALARCTPLLSEATRIARCGASIVRARAAVLGFGVAGGGRVMAATRERDVSSRLDLEEHDDDDDDDDDEDVVGVPDPDVLPTLLAYKDGELEKTFIRVDLEVGKGGLEALLLREDIISEGTDDSDEER